MSDTRKPDPRIPGLTPAQQQGVRSALATRLGGSVDVDAVLPALAAVLQESLPREVGDVAAFVSRLQAFSDDLRRDGRAGMARDLDRLAGVVSDLARSRSEAAALLDTYRYAADAEPAVAVSRLGWAAAQDGGRALAKSVRLRLEAAFAAHAAPARPAAP